MDKYVALQKEINGVLCNVFPKTYADIVTYKNSDVQTILDKLLLDLQNIYTKKETDDNIKTSCNDLYNKIIGIAGEDITVDEAYDTLKEVAVWINEHGEIAAGFMTDITGLKKAIGDDKSGIIKTLNDIKTIQRQDGDKITALQTAVSNLQEIVSDPITGLQKQVADNTDKIFTIQSKINNNELYVKNESGEILKDESGNAIINFL